MNDKFDVVSVDIGTGRVQRILSTGLTLRDAEAIVKMAVMRQGVETCFLAEVPADRFSVGDAYAPTT